MQRQGIPVGFDGQIRRVPGSNLQIDHAHPEIEFNLILRGRGAYLLGDQRFELQAGMLVWLQPGQRHRLVRSPGLEMWVVIVRPDLADDDLRRDIAAHPARILLGDDAVELDRLLSQVAQDADEPALFNAGLLYALRRARRASCDSEGGAREALHPAVTKALFLLRRHAASASLDELASACGVTQSYLSRLLVQQTGRGIIEWRNRAPLERFLTAYAARPSLVAAALDAGFGSYGQFYRSCRELMGCTPKEWVRGDPRTAATPFDIHMLDEPPSSAMAATLPQTRKDRERVPRTAPRPLPSLHGIPPAVDSSKRTNWHALTQVALPSLVPQ